MEDLEALRSLLSGRPEPSPRNSDDELYTAIPSGNSPRLLVPRHGRRVASSAIRHVIAPSSSKAKFRQAALVSMFSLGLGNLAFRDVLRVDSTASLATRLSRAVGEPVSVSVRFGPPRANRKPVLQLLDRRGNAVAFAKIGVNDLTRALVAAETEALRQISTRDLRPVRVPGIIYDGTWNDLELLVIEALPVWDRKASKTDSTGAVVEAMRAVAGPPTMRRLATAPYLDRLAKRVAALGNTAPAAVLMSSVEHARSVRARMPFGAWHGDWNGGNMAIRRDETLVWDWERYDGDVPMGYDMVHYELHEEVTVRGTDPVPAVRALLVRCDHLLTPFGVGPAQARAVTALYLTDIASRYLGDGQGQDAPRLGRAGEWIGEALAAAGDWWTELQEVAPHGA